MQINIGKADRPVDVDVEALAPNVLEYIIRYGLTQCLNDAHSSVTAKSEPDSAKRGEAAWELANKKLDALKAGEVRTARVGGGRTADPVKRKAREMALDVLKAMLGPKFGKADPAKVRAWVDDYLTRNPEMVEKARLAVEAAAELADGVEFDIDSLMADPAE